MINVHERFRPHDPQTTKPQRFPFDHSKHVLTAILVFPFSGLLSAKVIQKAPVGNVCIFVILHQAAAYLKGAIRHTSILRSDKTGFTVVLHDELKLK